MNNLVEIRKNSELVTTTEVIAKRTNVQHKNVIEQVREYKTDLEEFGIIAFETRKNRSGKPTEFCVLNESQTYYLLTLMRNNEVVIKFKKELVKEFMRMRKSLIQIHVQHQNKEWQQARLDGKAIRKETTDAIKDFVEYAVKQGSTNAVRYYSNISTMENKALFILEQKFDNIREVLNNHQLSTIKTADRIVYEALQEGMERSMNYKDIYKMAKERVESLATLVKPTIVISETELKLIE